MFANVISQMLKTEDFCKNCRAIAPRLSKAEIALQEYLLKRRTRTARKRLH
jgi:hypothetical protein